MDDPSLMNLPSCPGCGNILRRGFKYCPHCGRAAADAAVGSEDETTETNANRVGIFATILVRILHDLQSDERLRELFGENVLDNLVVVADENDLRIEEAGRVDIAEAGKDTFLTVLDEVIRKNAM